MKRVLTVIPFLHMALTIASNYIDWNYWIMGNIGGYSLLTNAFMGIVVFRNRFCIYTRMCVVGLIVINVLCLLGNLINYETYVQVYDLTTVTILTVVCLIIYIKRWYNMRT